MSVSINSPYYNLYDSWLKTNGTNTTTNSNSEAAESNQTSFGDYLQLASTTQGNSFNYSSNQVDMTNLTSKQKTAYLETMLNRIQEIDSTNSSTLPEDLKSALNSVSEILSDFNPTSNTEEEIATLFTSVTETMEKANPSKTEMQANGMTLPPPLPFINITQSEETASDTDSELAVDSMKEFISNLISSLRSNEEDTTSVSDTLGTDLTEELSDYKEASMTDEEVQALFNELISRLEESPTTNNSSIEAFPSSIQMTGSSLPPFNWRPSSTTVSVSTTN